MYYIIIVILYMENFSFIVLRHVCDEITNVYWNRCCDQLNTLYPECLKIVIDDHSICKPTTLEEYNIGNNILIINSELEPGRGEVLPYYYFLKEKFSKYAIIIHDTVIFHKRIHFNSTPTYENLWHFTGKDQLCKIIDKHFYNIVEVLDSKTELIKLYKQT